MKWCTEALRTLVFEYRIVTLDYFLHEMSISECYLCIDNLKWTDYTMKTLLRYNIWSMYNSNPFGKNHNSIEDIMKLPWDDADEVEVKGNIASEDERRKQQEFMKQMENMIRETSNKKNNS